MAKNKMDMLKEMLLKQMKMDPDNHMEVGDYDNIAEQERRKFNANATIRSLKWPSTQKEVKTCKGCGLNFITEYHSVAYCSGLCMKEELSRFGIDWQDKPLKKSFGGMTPPGIIPPDALEAMAKVLRLANYTVIDPHVVEVAIPNHTLVEAVNSARSPIQDQPEEEVLPQEDSEPTIPEQIQTTNETPNLQTTKPAMVDFDEFDFSLL